MYILPYLGLRIHAPLHSEHSCLRAKTVNISETVEERAKVTVNGGNAPYKIVHGLSIAAKTYDLK